MSGSERGRFCKRLSPHHNTLSSLVHCSILSNHAADLHTGSTPECDFFKLSISVLQLLQSFQFVSFSFLYFFFLQKNVSRLEFFFILFLRGFKKLYQSEIRDFLYKDQYLTVKFYCLKLSPLIYLINLLKLMFCI